ncbi:MAG: hypothetical protein FWB91_07175, partial [Defluviitaleaceae bacterium]|nr:hypothetical protein [Defluviitaleaceae bacterium]
MLKVIMILLLAVLTACGSGERENGDTGFYEPPENGGGKPATVEEDTEQPDIPAYDNYRVVLEIDPAARTVYGISQITFTNRTGKELETVVLQVYFSAFGQGFYPPPFFNESTLRIFRGPQIYG